MKPQAHKAAAASPLSTLEGDLDVARRTCEAALDTFDGRLAEYNQALSLGDRAAALKRKATLDEATLDRDMAVATVARLERELIEAHESAKNARVMALYEQARGARDAAGETLKKEYPRLAAGIIDLTRVCEEADELVAQANRDLPEGYAPLDTSETHARFIPGRPREVVSEEIVERWAYVSTKQICDIFQDAYRLKTTDGKTGVLYGPNSNIPVALMPFKMLTHKPEQRRINPELFRDSLRLPALQGDYLIYPTHSHRFTRLGRDEIFEAARSEASRASKCPSSR